MNNKKNNKKFRLLPGSILYFFLLIYSILLTQLLRNAISAALLLFVIVLPFISLIHCLIGRSAIMVYVSSEKQRAEKYEPVEYDIKIINTSFLAYPFVEAVISEPGTNAPRCTKRKFVLSLVSFGSYIVNNTVEFKYRGYYEIGVDSLYISDLFRFFAIRADAENYTAISVFPRKMSIVDNRRKAVTDTPSPSLIRDVTAEKNEFTDIRDYIPGDSIRDIHWKLSSKTQDLMIKQYSSAEDRHVYIFCDMARATMPPKKDDYSDEYANLKKIIDESEKDKSKKIRRSVKASQKEIEKKAELVETFLGGEVEEEEALSDKIKKKRRESKYRKNIRSGMSEKEAETIRSIDELINSVKKKKKTKLKNNTDASDADEVVEAAGVSEIESDINRILSMTALPDYDPKSSDRVYGGRVKEEELEDYDEFCLDAVVEMTVAETMTELKSGSKCTVAWYDDRDDRGLSLFDLGGASGFEELFLKLTTAEAVSNEAYVANLGALVSDSTNVTLKVVTSNLDPQSAAEIGALPSKFGGAGTGCSVEVVMFSPAEKYEDPALRAVYTSDVALEFARQGISPTVLSESRDGSGAPVFTPVS